MLFRSQPLRRFLIEWECDEYVYPWENKRGMLEYIWPLEFPHAISRSPMWTRCDGFLYVRARNEQEAIRDFRKNEVHIRDKREAPSRWKDRKKLARCRVTLVD